MKLTVRFKTRDFAGDLWPDLKKVVNRYSFAAVGGPDSCTIGCFGEDEKLWQMTEMLRCPVEVYDERGRCVWWGYINRVTVRKQAVQVQVGLTLDSMANRIAARYSYVAPGSNVVGTVVTTAWAEDARSIAEYGYKELLKNIAGSTAANAVIYRDELLSRVKLPVMDPPEASGAENSASALLECVGWWRVLGWRYAEVGLTSAISFTTNDTYAQVRSVSTAFKFLQQVTVGANALAAKGVDLFAWKVGTPTDNLVVGIYAVNSSGNLSGSALASGTIAGASLTTSGVWTRVTLSAEAQLKAGTMYAIAIWRSGATDLSNYFRIGIDSVAGYSGGVSKTSADDGGSWSAQTYDLAFVIRQTNNVQTTEQVRDLMTLLSNGFLTPYIETPSGLVESSYQDGTRKVKAVVEELLAKGVSGGRRLLAQVDVNRLVRIYEEPENTEMEYLLAPNGRLVSEGGGPVELHTCPVGAWCGMSEIIPQTVDFSLLSSPTPFFIEWSEWDPQSGGWSYKTRDVPGLWD